MTTFTIADIRSWKPDFDPSQHLPEDWSGTARDILGMESIPIEDRFWVVLRPEVIGPRTLRLFAVRACDPVRHLITDPRPIHMLDVAERFARGEATAEELREAYEGAWAADADAEAGATARAAAYDAARRVQIDILRLMLANPETQPCA